VDHYPLSKVINERLEALGQNLHMADGVRSGDFAVDLYKGLRGSFRRWTVNSAKPYFLPRTTPWSGWRQSKGSNT
jgi:hypothetical protein